MQLTGSLFSKKGRWLLHGITEAASAAKHYFPLPPAFPANQNNIRLGR